MRQKWVQREIQWMLNERWISPLSFLKVVNTIMGFIIKEPTRSEQSSILLYQKTHSSASKKEIHQNQSLHVVLS